ncbi:hypothetical protein BGX34_003420 [Mortierella sp. NVP85]|nr:hypothetical protein BGX34_003420 [Mortierella sp. NVP85]
MDAKQQQPSQGPNSHDPPHGKGKAPSREGSASGSASGSPSGATDSFVGSVAASARNMASALDPRQPSLLGQLSNLGSSTTGPSGGSVIGSSSKPSTSAASRSFQHASNAIETLESNNHRAGSSSRSSGAVDTPSGFKTTPSAPSSQAGTMDWDNFLTSSESTLQDDPPYKPPSFESFGFSSTFKESGLPYRPYYPNAVHQQETRSFESTDQTHSQSIDLTPSNHTAFLEYLKSTGNSSSPSTGSSAWPQQAQPPLHHRVDRQANEWHATSGGPLASNDIQRQQLMDGGEVMAFLESTSYADFVDQIEAEGIDKHQQDRRTFVYSETSLGPQSHALFSALQLIQHLPSERQDVVQYLLQQGTYTDDVWGRPFAHDTAREEAASLAATRAEQDQFLQRTQQTRAQGEGAGATTEEMERILKQIVEDAKIEVKTGETNGKALNRLMTVRNRITSRL